MEEKQVVISGILCVGISLEDQDLIMSFRKDERWEIKEIFNNKMYFLTTSVDAMRKYFNGEMYDR